jgi:hypothetical protein
MSSFDDEFGLFGEEQEESERRPTLGARNLAGDEPVNSEIEPEDEQPRRRGVERRPPQGGRGGGRPPYGGGRYAGTSRREPADPVAAQKRAADLLQFLASKLVTKPDAVQVDSFPPENGEQAALELIVDPEDLGKVIGRSGRVAQALRTIVRATAEGKLAVDIYDTEELAASESEDAGEKE